MNMSVKRSDINNIQPQASKYQKNGSSQVSRFTTMPNELMIMMFTYLKPIDILYSFSSLNRRFNSLIHKYKQNFDLRSLTDEYRLQQILELISNDVVSLKIDRNIFTGDNLFQQFPSLQQLSISKINLTFSQQLHPLVRSFKRLTKLELKSFDINNYINHTKLVPIEFIHEIFQNDSLVEELFIGRFSSLSYNTTVKFSPCNLTKLEIHLTKGQDLFFLFGYIPVIKIFKCHMSYFITNQDMLTTTPTVDTPYLIEFELVNIDYSTELVAIAALLKDRRSLERLSLNSTLPNNERGLQYLDGNRLREELLQNLIHLRLFQFNFQITYHDSFPQPNMTHIMSTFYHDFWLKDHEWKVGGCCYSNNDRFQYCRYNFFSLPYAYPHFLPTLTRSNFNNLKITIPLLLSSDLFNNVQSIDVEIEPTDTDLSTLKLVEAYFKRVTYLSLYMNENQRLSLSADHPCLPNVKKLKFNGRYEHLKQLLSIFTNLTELIIPQYEIWENAESYLYENDGDKDLLQLKHLHTVTVVIESTYQGSEELDEMHNEFEKCFGEHLPGVILRWFPPKGDEEHDKEEDEDGDGEED